MKKLKVLIIGRGFIGLHLVEKFEAQGADVYTFSRTPRLSDDRAWTGDFSELDPSAPMFQISYDLIFHVLSSTTPASSDQNIPFDVNSNLIGTVNFLANLSSSNKAKVVFISSAGTIYGPTESRATETSPTEPICSYGVTKLAIEKHLALANRKFGLDYLILRVSNPYGNWPIDRRPFGLINNFVERVLNGQQISIFGDMETERDFISVDDLTDGIFVAAQQKTSHRLFNLSYGKSYTLAKVVQFIEAELTSKIDIKHLPARDFDLKKVRIDNSLFKETFQWQPRIDLSKGIKKLILDRKRI